MKTLVSQHLTLCCFVGTKFYELMSQRFENSPERAVVCMLANCRMLKLTRAKSSVSRDTSFQTWGPHFCLKIVTDGLISAYATNVGEAQKRYLGIPSNVATWRRLTLMHTATQHFQPQDWIWVMIFFFSLSVFKCTCFIIVAPINFIY